MIEYNTETLHTVLEKLYHIKEDMEASGHEVAKDLWTKIGSTPWNEIVEIYQGLMLINQL